MVHPSYPRSSVLILGQSCIYSLLPSTLFSQVESLLQNGLLTEAEALLENAEAGLAHGTTSSGDQAETLRYLHQSLAFAFMRQTRFREATNHFVRGAIDPRVPISYFDELRPALFDETPDSPDGETAKQSTEQDSVDVEVWDGVREYMPKETSIDDLIAINLVRNYSPYLRPGALPGSPDEKAPPDGTLSASASESGTRTHPATIAMREDLRADANDMVKSILAAVLGNADVWPKDIIEITSTALALLYAHARDVQSLLALFAPPAPRTLSSRPVSRAASRPPSRLGSTSHTYMSNGPASSVPSDTRHTSHPSQSIPPIISQPVLPFRLRILAPTLAQLRLWGILVEMWKIMRGGEKVVEILVGLVEGKYIDPSVIDPLEQIFVILSPTPPDRSNAAVKSDFSLSEHERASLVRKWAAWLAGKDGEKGLKLLTSLQPSRPRRGTGAAARGRVAEREATQKVDELALLSELRNTNILAAKRYLEWLVIGRGLGRGGKETKEEMELFEELAWSCVQEVLDFVADENVGKLWRAKAASYASSPSTSNTTTTSQNPPKSPSPPSAPTLSLQPPRSPFLSYFASTTPDSPSKRARIRTILVLESLGEGKQIVKDVQEKIISGGWDKTLGLEMAILHSKIPSPQTTLRTLHALRDTSTAELYASSSGVSGVVCTKVGESAAEGCGLAEWGGWFARGGTGGGSKGGDMLRTLLEVYMEDGDSQQTARLLSSQATKLDVADIIPLVPTSWSLCTLSTYLTRSLRRSQHLTHEGQIVKAICTGRNLAVLESTYEVLQEEGAIVEEAVTDDEDEDIGGENEKPGSGGDVGRSFDEKVGLRGPEGEVGVGVVDVRVGSVS